MVGFFCVALVLILIVSHVQRLPSPIAWERMGMIAVIIGVELSFRWLVITRIRQQQPLPRWIWYPLACVEVGVYSTGVALTLPEPFLSLPALLPQAGIYCCFIIIATLRLHFGIVLFTGFTAALGYGLVVYFSDSMMLVPVDLTERQHEVLTDFSSRNLLYTALPMILSVSVLAGYVAQHVRRQTLAMLREAHERMRLEREVVSIAGEERRRVGRDLHDGLGSHLTGLSMHARALARRAELGRPLSSDGLESLAEGIESGIDQARALAQGLDPLDIDHRSLVSALDDLTQSISVASGQPCRFESDVDQIGLTSEAAEHLYRIAQEATTNAVRHAQASRVDVSLRRESAHLVLAVRDDGIGLDNKAQGGMGLRTMHYRARVIGGDLSAVRVKGGGTLVRCEVPIFAIT